MRAATFVALALGLAATGVSAGGAGCSDVQPLAMDAGLDGGVPRFAQAVVPAGLETVSWFGVHGSAPDNVVMVGQGGRIMRWNGTALTEEQSGTTQDLRGVFVVDKDVAWAVGASGTVLRALDGKWSPQTTGTMDYLSAVWSDGMKQMVTVGEKGSAWVFDSTFHPATTDSPDDLFALAQDKDGLFAVGTLGTIARYDGKGAFKRSALSGYSKTLTGAAAGKGGTWVVGVGGAVYRTDGNLTQITGVPSVFVRGVSAPGPSAWVVGFDALVVQVKAGKATVYTDVPDRWYEAVFATSDEDVWVVGNAGAVLHTNPLFDFDGGTGSTSPKPGDGGGGAG